MNSVPLSDRQQAKLYGAVFLAGLILDQRGELQNPNRSPRKLNTFNTIIKAISSNENPVLKAIANLTGLYTMYSIFEDSQEILALERVQETIENQADIDQNNLNRMVLCKACNLRIARKFTDMLIKSFYLGSAISTGIGYAVASPLVFKVGAFAALLSVGLLFLRATREEADSETSFGADIVEAERLVSPPLNPPMVGSRFVRQPLFGR